MARYYAMSWTHGQNVTTTRRRGYPHGEQTVRAANYYSFPTRAARDAFCAGGSSYRTERDYREPVPASDSWLRCYLREMESDEERVYLSEETIYGESALVPRAEFLSGEYLDHVERDAFRACPAAR